MLARRPASKVYAGYWEFPGGKVEAGETTRQALERELAEELGIRVTTAFPWITQEFIYPHASVRLNFFRVTAWQGEVRTLEHEGMSWQFPDRVAVTPLLPANGPVLRGLALPQEYAITHCLHLGLELQMAHLQRCLDNGLRLIQVREPGMDAASLEDFIKRVIALARPEGALVLLNADVKLAERIGADGVHLTSRQVLALDARPALPWVGASCHQAEELRAAEKLGADFAVLGSVLPTPSHPGVNPLGWTRFETIARGAALPVFALGGVSSADKEESWRRGGHGIAMQRAAWRN